MNLHPNRKYQAKSQTHSHVLHRKFPNLCSFIDQDPAPVHCNQNLYTTSFGCCRTCICGSRSSVVMFTCCPDTRWCAVEVTPAVACHACTGVLVHVTKTPGLIGAIRAFFELSEIGFYSSRDFSRNVAQFVQCSVSVWKHQCRRYAWASEHARCMVFATEKGDVR